MKKSTSETIIKVSSKTTKIFRLLMVIPFLLILILILFSEGERWINIITAKPLTKSELNTIGSQLKVQFPSSIRMLKIFHVRTMVYCLFEFDATDLESFKADYNFYAVKRRDMSKRELDYTPKVDPIMVDMAIDSILSRNAIAPYTMSGVLPLRLGWWDMTTENVRWIASKTFEGKGWEHDMLLETTSDEIVRCYIVHSVSFSEMSPDFKKIFPNNASRKYESIKK